MTATKVERIKEQVLKQIRPTDKKLLEEIDSFILEINEEIKKKKVRATAVVGGSISKDTYLKGDHDCDVFLRFDYSYKNKDISALLETVLQKFKPVLVHGSRDYYHILKKINYEIVPVLAIDDVKDAVNVTDMSPLHTAWVTNWVKKKPGMNDEIRLSKQFCKAIRVYGAESYIKGFSGHVLDILTIHYGGFEKLLLASQKWQSKQVIDSEKHYRGKKPLEELNRSKLDSPIIVIDPVTPNRNAAAALSEEKVEKFKLAAAQFIEKPSKKMFEVVPLTVAEIKKKIPRGKKLILLEVKAHEGKEDIVGAKIMKAFQAIRNRLTFYDFNLHTADWWWDKKTAYLWFVVDKKDLMPIMKRIGPPLKEKDRVANFKEKHAKTFTDDDRICTYMKRQFVNADKVVKEVLKDPLVTERVKKITMKKV